MLNSLIVEASVRHGGGVYTSEENTNQRLLTSMGSLMQSACETQARGSEQDRVTRANNLAMKYKKRTGAMKQKREAKLALILVNRSVRTRRRSGK